MEDAELTMRLRAFVVQKHGNRLRDCEDSASISQRTGRCAVADGASQSWAAREWAQTLTECWIEDPPASASAFDAWLDDAQAVFAERDVAESPEVPAYLSQTRTARDDPAHATLLGAVLTDATPAQLRLLALGDSYAFLVRAGELIGSLPHGVDAALFDSTPDLLTSCDAAPASIVSATLTVADGDRCYLVTDALAEVLRDRHLDGEPLWDRLDDLDADGYLDLVDELREAGMDNDDTTLVVAAFEPKGPVERF